MSAHGAIHSNTKRWLIRLTGTALFLGVLFWLLPVEAIKSALLTLRPQVFLAVLILFLLAHVFAALKWRLLLGAGITVNAAIRAHFAGLAANLCLPGAIGGDAVRAGMAHTEIKNGSHIAAVAAIDRLIDMIALLAVSVIGLLVSGVGVSEGQLVFRVAVAMVFVVGGIVAFPKLLPVPWKLFPALPGRGFAHRLVSSFVEFGQKPVLLVVVLISSVSIQMLLVILAYWLATDSGADIEVGYWIFAWPLAKIIAILPISLNGLGVREATLAAMLSPMGAESAVIVAAGLAWQAVMFISGGVGGVILLLARSKRAQMDMNSKGVSE